MWTQENRWSINIFVCIRCSDTKNLKKKSASVTCKKVYVNAFEFRNCQSLIGWTLCCIVIVNHSRHQDRVTVLCSVSYQHAERRLSRWLLKWRQNLLFRPHRSTTYVDATYFYRPSKVVCRSVTLVSPAEKAEPIETPFGLRTLMGPENHVLDGGPDPFWWERTIWTGKRGVPL